MLTHVRVANLKLGLVVNLCERMVTAGIHRVVNGLPHDIDFNAKTQRRRDAPNPRLSARKLKVPVPPR
jgi:hypothetical protein